ncbi:ABC transporter permease [Mycoplasma yeatsii]|uniref:ABC transporter permease n=1 Tax=Mycoplasma yeatsii TaxID=51365 RepID=UPI0005B23C31|nr:FtsX-like permease family protein [Mycoplasma yeatsii]AJM72112.1 putative permease [Mycoplasma yeatsii GM274B]
MQKLKNKYSSRNWFFLMLKNSFKNSFKNKAQLFGLTILVSLMALVMSLISSIDSNVLNRYDSLVSNSNQHNIVLKLNPKDSVENNQENVPNNLVEAQQYWIDQLNIKYKEKYNQSFDWSRTEAREFSQVYSNNNLQTLKAIAKTSSKTDQVDKLVISQGNDINSINQVVLDSIYAQKHNIKIKDIIRIQKDKLGDQLLVSSNKNASTNAEQHRDIELIKQQGLDDKNGIYQLKYAGTYSWFQVVGFGESADFIAPIINQHSPISNRNTQGLIYVDPFQFGLIKQENNFYNYDETIGKLVVGSDSEIESFYSIKINDFIDNEKLNFLNNTFKQLIKNNTDKTFFYEIGDKNYIFNKRTSLINKTIRIYNITSSILLFSILCVVLYTTSLMTKKQIENSRSQIGTMRALGYKKQQIVFNYVVTPLITSFVGGIIGYVVAVGVSIVILNKLQSYFTLSYGVASFDWIGFLFAFIFIWILMSVISFLIAYLIMKTGALNLIYAQRTKKLSKWSMMVKRNVQNKSFNKKMRTALLIDAGPKMFGVGFVVLLSTIMFTISFSAPYLLKRNQAYTYNGINYKQVVEYSEPSYNNPFSFSRVFNPENDYDEYKVIKKSEDSFASTSLPVKDNSYDIEQIISQYSNQTYGSSYYNLAIPTIDKSGDAEPYSLGVSNIRMLQAQDTSISTGYFRQLAKLSLSETEPFFANAVLNNWFDYKNLTSELLVDKKDDFKTLLNQFKHLQRFYSIYLDSIALSINRDYYLNDNEQFDINLDEEKRIEKFNSIDKKQQALLKFADESVVSASIAKQLQTQTIKDRINNFKLSSSSSKMGKYHIIDGIWNKDDSVEDNILKLSENDFKDDLIDENKLLDLVAKLGVWWTVLFKNRMEQGIVQAAYSRAPYFVRQNLKIAYDNNKQYTLGFNLIPFTKDKEQLGTLLNVETLNKKHNFKIYGIKNNNKFINLFDTNKNNLISKLYNTEKNTIIINQTISKRLNLYKGDEIDLNVLQNELQKIDNNNIKPYNTSDWKDQFDSPTSDFIQRSDISTASTSVKNPFNNNVEALTNGIPVPWDEKDKSLDPNPFYKEFLQGNTSVNKINKQHKFKVVGVHDAYGQGAAWIKEDNAQEILNYKQNKEVWWELLFKKQWNKVFDKQGYVVDQINTGLNLTGNDSLQNYSYQDFVNKLIKENKNEKQKQAAQNILKIFANTFPIFNYKYSLKDDIGDLSKSVSTYSKTGDYNPVTLNGVHVKDHQVYDGIGQGSINLIVPIKISQAILKQISALIILLLALGIVAILSISFVIILLTTSVIISDNNRFISTLKVLGYSNSYIALNILGMYFIVIASMFLIGITSGWFIFSTIIKSIYHIVVLPLAFPIWLPFAVALGVIGIYIITIAVGFNSISKTDATLTLKDVNI